MLCCLGCVGAVGGALALEKSKWTKICSVMEKIRTFCFHPCFCVCFGCSILFVMESDVVRPSWFELTFKLTLSHWSTRSVISKTYNLLETYTYVVLIDKITICGGWEQRWQKPSFRYKWTFAGNNMRWKNRFKFWLCFGQGTGTGGLIIVCVCLCFKPFRPNVLTKTGK